jgi:hypothetical protein
MKRGVSPMKENILAAIYKDHNQKVVLVEIPFVPV